MIQNLTSRLQVSDAGSLHTDLTLSVELAFECLVHVGRGTWTIHYTSCMADMINISCMLSEVHRLHMCTTWKPCLLSHSHFGLMQYLAFSADWQQLKVTMLSQVRVACVHPQTVKAQLCITHKLNSGLLCWLLGLSVKPNSFVGHSAIVSWLPLDRQTDRQTERWQTNRQASRQPNRQMTDRQAGRQADMQLNRQRDGRQRGDRLTGRPAGSPTGRCQTGRWQTKPIAYPCTYACSYAEWVCIDSPRLTLTFCIHWQHVWVAAYVHTVGNTHILVYNVSQLCMSMNMWQSREIAYFHHLAGFEAPYCWTSHAGQISTS